MVRGRLGHNVRSRKPRRADKGNSGVRATPPFVTQHKAGEHDATSSALSVGRAMEDGRGLLP